jgi:hypothetical protein
MITSAQAAARYGEPELEAAMTLFHIPAELRHGHIPERVYCNRELVAPLTAALRNVHNRGLGDQLRTWDGCFQIRRKRGGAAPSLHSWGLAIDINAAWNGFGKPPTMSPELVRAFTDAGFDWGGTWRSPDGMHFQLAKFPEADHAGEAPHR